MVLTVVRHHKANIALNRRDAMIEFIARANYGLRCGNFDMDYRNGEMRFQVATACSYLQLSELGPQVQSMFKTAMGMASKAVSSCSQPHLRNEIGSWQGYTGFIPLVSRRWRMVKTQPRLTKISSTYSTAATGSLCLS